MLNVGIDWAEADDLQYVILSDDGRCVKEGDFSRTLEGVDQLSEQIYALQDDPEQVRVGMDRKYDIVSAVLFEKGFTVYALNPQSTNVARKAYHPAGKKDDRVDARLHANIVRKDWRFLQLYSPKQELDTQLRELLNTRKSLVDAKRKAKQELRSLLTAYAPLLADVTGDFRPVWEKQILKRWPLDQDFCDAHGNELNAFVDNHRLRKATEKKIRHAKHQRSVRHGPEMADCHRMLIVQKVEQIEFYEKQILQVERKISESYKKHDDEEIFSSLPTGDDHTRAAFCLLFDENEKEHRSWRNYASYYGAAPVTKSSGKNKIVKMRRAYDETIHKALIDFADASRHLKNCWARRYYWRKREAGKGHYETLRQLALKWVKITHAMWRNRTKYDENYISQRFRQSQKCAA